MEKGRGNSPLSKQYKLTQAQTLLLIHLKELKLEAVPEYRFHETRKWRFDVYIPAARIGIELDGGIFTGGHRRGTAIELDHEKSNQAQMMGIRVLRFTNRQVLNGVAREFISGWL